MSLVVKKGPYDDLSVLSPDGKARIMERFGTDALPVFKIVETHILEDDEYLLYRDESGVWWSHELDPFSYPPPSPMRVTDMLLRKSGREVRLQRVFAPFDSINEIVTMYIDLFFREHPEYGCWENNNHGLISLRPIDDEPECL